MTESLDQRITSAQAAKLRQLLDADRPEAISMLTASHPFGDASAIVSFAPDLERYLRRNQDSGSRDYGTALYLLGEISRLVDVSVAPFVYALRHYPSSNESETAVGAVKRLAKRVARTQDRAALDRFVAQLGGDLPPDLQTFISNLVSPA